MLTIPGGGPSPGPAATYTVRRGDTLGGIAARFGTTVQALLRANPQVTNPNKIFEGQVLSLGAIGPPPPNPASGDWPHGGLPATGSGAALGDADFRRAANAVGCEVACIRAVAAVEASGSGFLRSGKPKILFERHIFARRTGGAFNSSHPHISSRASGGYGAAGEHQYERLAQAQHLNHRAALESASWGLFQIMGLNHGTAGYATVTAYVAAMFSDEGRHLDAVVGFLQANRLDAPLREKRWRDFTRGYNGADGIANGYHTKLQRAYERFAR